MVKVVYLSKETLHDYFPILVVSEQSTEFPAIFLKCRLEQSLHCAYLEMALIFLKDLGFNSYPLISQIKGFHWWAQHDGDTFQYTSFASSAESLWQVRTHLQGIVLEGRVTGKLHRLQSWFFQSIIHNLMLGFVIFIKNTSSLII